MMRSLLLSCCGVGLLSLTGCSGRLLNNQLTARFSTDHRVVNQFAEAVEEGNESALRRAVSTRFEHKAMRAEQPLRDLNTVDLPTGPLRVVEAEETEDGHRIVTVEEAEDGPKYQYELVRDELKDRWVVDDVMISQSRRNVKGTRPVTEIVDLLVTLRDFMREWEAADGSSALGMASPELREAMEPLPLPWRAALTRRIAEQYDSKMSRRPEVQFSGSDAVAKLPARDGYLLIQLSQDAEDARWLVNDAELHHRRKQDEHPGSVQRQARAMAAVTGFLTEYEAADREGMEQAATPELFREALAASDVSRLPLPSPGWVPEEFEIRAFNGRLTILLPESERMVRFDLSSAADGETMIRARRLQQGFLVSDVVLYDRRSGQEQDLASYFTAPVRATMFLEALRESNLPVLRRLASGSMRRESLDRIAPAHMTLLPINDLPLAGFRHSRTTSRSGVTELEYSRADGAMLSVLLEDDGHAQLVRDVHFPGREGAITSLRERLAMAVPTLEFASAVHADDLRGMQEFSSSELNRLVLKQVSEVSPGLKTLVVPLSGLPDEVVIHNESALLKYQPIAGPAIEVALSQEDAGWLIDDIVVTESNGRKVGMRGALRQQIARNSLSRGSGIRQASHSRPYSQRMPSALVNGTPAMTEPSVRQGNVRQAGPQTSGSTGGVRHAVFTRELPSGANPNPPVQDPFGFGTDQSRISPVQSGDISRSQPPARTASTEVSPSAGTESGGLLVFGPGSQRSEDTRQAATVSGMQRPVHRQPRPAGNPVTLPSLRQAEHTTPRAVPSSPEVGATGAPPAPQAAAKSADALPDGGTSIEDNENYYFFGGGNRMVLEPSQSATGLKSREAAETSGSRPASLPGGFTLDGVPSGMQPR